MIVFLLELPIALMATLMIGGTTGVAWTLVEIVHRSPLARFKPSFRNMLPPLGGAMMAGYVIFSALLANSIWHAKEYAERAVAQEAQALGLSQRLIDSNQQPEWRATVAAYAKVVTEQEWSTMSDGRESQQAREHLDKLHHLAMTGLPGLPAEVRKTLDNLLKDVESARLNRLLAAVDGIPTEIWITVVLTALVVLSFSALGHQHDLGAARTMATLFGLMIGAVLFSIIAVDRPFIGKVSVSSAPLRQLWLPNAQP